MNDPAPETIIAAPITAAAFAPFGEVLIASPDATRRDHSAGLRNLRAQASVYLSSTTAAAATLPLKISLLERHVYSSQTFLPINASAYLVVVAPNDATGGPDLAKLAAFVVPGDVGITYRAGVWHHPMTALDAPASFSILMWCDGTAGDEEILPLPRSIEISA